MADATAPWPFQLDTDEPLPAAGTAPWPFQLDKDETPTPPSPARRVLEAVTPPLKTAWDVVTGQTPLLKSGQSDWQTVKEGFSPPVSDPETPTLQAPADSEAVRPFYGVRPQPSPEYAEKLANRSWESYKAELPPGIPPTTVGPSTPEAIKADMDRAAKASKEQALFWMEIIAGLVASGAMPAAAVPSAVSLLNSGRLMGIVRNFGPELLRKMGIAAAPAAVDVVMGAPEKALGTFGANLAGEYIGGGTGRTVSKVGQRLDRARESVFGQTDEAAMHSGVIRGLGEEPPLGIASGKYLPKAVDTAGTESVWTSRVRDKYASVTSTLDDELKRIQELHPGGLVTAERDRIAGRVGALADETRMRAVPGEVRYQLDRYAKNSMPSVVNADLRTGYQNLDADYFSRQVSWSQVKNNLPDTQPIRALAQQNPGSMFAHAERLVDNMTLLGDNVTLDTAMDMQRTVDGFLKQARAHVESLPPGSPERTTLTAAIQYQVEPILGQVQQHINGLIRPYAVNLQASKEYAEKIVARAGVSDAVLEGLLSAGNITGQTVDPDVLLAYHLLKQPDFVNFSQAHGLRHEWLAASRLPGHPLIGESTVTRSKGMADQIDGAMKVMTSRMTPEMTTAWKAMDQQYKGLAQLYNSEYIGEVASMNLDDILTQLIRLDRPNDIQALRQALGQTRGGGDMLDEVAQMWWSKRLEMATPGSTGKAGIDDLLVTLDSMPTQTREALFPGYPIEAVRDTLRRGKDMIDAVDIVNHGVKADPVALQEVMGRLPPRYRERVLSDVLHPMFTKGGPFDPIDSGHFLSKLQDLHTAGVDAVLFTPEHYENLYHLAHTARAVKEMTAEGHRRYSPAVRVLERGGPLASGSALTGALALAWYGHPGKAIVAGTIGAALPVISARGLAFLATNPRMVKRLTEGMTTSFSAKRAGEITGQLLGTLYANGLGEEVTMQPAPAAVPEQESQAAPGGAARTTD